MSTIFGDFNQGEELFHISFAFVLEKWKFRWISFKNLQGF